MLVVRIHLGCGTCRLAGYRHVDIVSLPGIDVIHDLNELPWPWLDESVDAIVAEDVIEHLEIDLIRFCDEAWRVLRPFGELFVRTPSKDSENSWIDPTHRWHLDERSFHYLDPDTYFGRTFSHYTRCKWKLASLGLRNTDNIHAVLVPRK